MKRNARSACASAERRAAAAAQARPPCRRCASIVEHPADQRPDRARRLAPVDDVSRRQVAPQRGDPFRRLDVALADLEEAPAARAARQGSPRNSPASELSTTSTPRPPVAAQDLVGEVERARVEHVLARPASAAARASTANPPWRTPPRRRACARRTAARPTPPAAAWISTRSPRCRPPRCCRAEGGRDERDRHRGAFGGHRLRPRRHTNSAGSSRATRSSRRPAPPRRRPRFRSVTPGADRHDHAGAFAAQRPRVAGVHAEHVEHVLEVEPGGVDSISTSPAPGARRCAAPRWRRSDRTSRRARRSPTAGRASRLAAQRRARRARQPRDAPPRLPRSATSASRRRARPARRAARRTSSARFPGSRSMQRKLRVFQRERTCGPAPRGSPAPDPARRRPRPAARRA